MPNIVVTDAQSIADYYHEKYRRDSVMIPYGAELGPVATDGALHQLGLEKAGYFLYVSRMEPENNGLLVRESFERVSTDLKLALIGDAPYAAVATSAMPVTAGPMPLWQRNRIGIRRPARRWRNRCSVRGSSGSGGSRSRR